MTSNAYEITYWALPLCFNSLTFQSFINDKSILPLLCSLIGRSDGVVLETVGAYVFAASMAVVGSEAKQSLIYLFIYLLLRIIG